jgi:hypothetical protein
VPTMAPGERKWGALVVDRPSISTLGQLEPSPARPCTWESVAPSPLRQASPRQQEKRDADGASKGNAGCSPEKMEIRDGQARRTAHVDRDQPPDANRQGDPDNDARSRGDSSAPPCRLHLSRVGTLAVGVHVPRVSLIAIAGNLDRTLIHRARPHNALPIRRRA